MENKNNKQKTPGVVSLPFNTVVLGMPNSKSIIFFSCPFCYAVYLFPQNIIKNSKAKCACGANFSVLGTAQKNIKEDTIL